MHLSLILKLKRILFINLLINDTVMAYLVIRYHNIMQKIFFILIFSSVLIAQYPPDAGYFPVDVKSHRMGNSLLVNNLATTNMPEQYNPDLFPNWLMAESGQGVCCAEDGHTFSGNGIGTLIVGAMRGSQKIFTRGHGWRADGADIYGYEWWPTQNEWDTVWVVAKGDTGGMPYWPDFVGFAQQNFVTHYGDYYMNHPEQQNQLRMEVIQTSHAWGMKGYSNWLLFDFYLIPKTPLTDVWVGRYNMGGIGSGSNIGQDDILSFDFERQIGFTSDPVGNDDDYNTSGDRYDYPRAFKMYPPEGYTDDELQWTFEHGQYLNHIDIDMYDFMTSGNHRQPGNDPRGISSIWMAMGPFDLVPGDTLKFRVVSLQGTSEDDIRETLDRLDEFVAAGYPLPSPPPAPKLKAIPGDNQVRLYWYPEGNEENVEEWQDPVRLDYGIVQQPFEGYQLFKSSVSENGPWTLLAIYDVPGNEFNSNFGIEREYIDVGLLNNLEYYYGIQTFSKPDQVSGYGSLSSSLETVTVIPGTAVPDEVGMVAVVPNPYRGDEYYHYYNPAWEKASGNIVWTANENYEPMWLEQDRRIQFINVPSPSEIIIYSLSGDLVRTIKHNNPLKGYIDWNLTSDVGQTIASGVYLYTVQSQTTGNIQVGKFVVVK
tara:strand:- start:11463 stop:13418 length:1956 start_codon:yes stop_codon:yes gene_type:complete